MLLLALGAVVAVGAVTTRLEEVVGSAALAATVAVAATCAKLAFDSLVQRDAPDANRGRSFARFEVRFQLVWVVGAVVPVLISIPLHVGFVIVVATAGFALFSYLAGQRAARRAHVDRPPTGPGITPDQARPAESATRDLGEAPDLTWVQHPPGTDPTQTR